jgi:hypothetical protein
MVVMFVGCLVLGDNPNIILFLPYKTYGAVVFVSAQTKIVVKLLRCIRCGQPVTLAGSIGDNPSSEVQSKMICMGHQILSCHVPVVRSFFILWKTLLSS